MALAPKGEVRKIAATLPNVEDLKSRYYDGSSKIMQAERVGSVMKPG
jgi:hypothetical protein